MRLAARVARLETKAAPAQRVRLYHDLTDEEQAAVDAGTFDPNAKVLQVTIVHPDGTVRLYRGQGRQDETLGAD